MPKLNHAIGRFVHDWLNPIGVFVRSWTGLINVLVFLFAIGLGYWGWWIARPPANMMGAIDNAFSTLQLLTLRSTGNVEMSAAWQLNVARFLIPAAALVGSYRLVLANIRSPARLAMLGLRRGHIVIAPGHGPTGMALLREIYASRLRAVAVGADLKTENRTRIEEHGVAVLASDPSVPATWLQARADHADLIVVSCGSDVENLNIVVGVAYALHFRKLRHGPMLVAAVENELLAEQVDVALDNAARGSGLRYRRLSIPDEAARMIFLDPPLPARKQRRTDPSHIIVMGLGPGAHAVLRHALTLGQDAESAGPRISVLAPEKELAAETLLRPGTIPAYVATLRGIPCDFTAGLPQSALDTLLAERPPVDLVCVCLADDAAVTIGLALAQYASLQQWPEFTIAVHQQREDRFLSLLASEQTMRGHARLRPFGGLLPPGTLQRLRDERHNRLPRAVHEHYLAMMRRLHATGGTSESWEDLPENIRHANRAAADHISVKLAAIGCHSATGKSGTFAFTDAEVDALARIEHRRWSAERLLRGWRPGARDNDKWLHPDLVPYEELTEEGREKDRDAIVRLPQVLALAGRSIQRDPQARPHARPAAQRNSQRTPSDSAAA